ncbi:MAG: CheY-like chemotaxis protein, partial [bacterium]
QEQLKTPANLSPWIVEHKIYHVDGTSISVETSIEVLAHKTGEFKGAIGITRESTEQRQTEQKAKLAKNIFIANMVHEIRTPMNVILGFSEILKDRNKDIQSNEYLTIISDNGVLLLKLLDSLLDITNLETGMIELNPSAVNIRKIIKEIQKLQQNKSDSSKIKIHNLLLETFPSDLYLDESRLHQILLGLIKTLSKYNTKKSIQVQSNFELINNTEDGLLTITIISVEPEVEKPLTINSEHFIELIDSKITPDLQILCHFIHLMGGKIFATQEKNNLYCFQVLFYKVKRLLSFQEEVITLEDSFQLKNSSTQFKAKILIADDEYANRKLLKCYLDNPLYEVFEAEDGQQAIQLAKKINPDIVLMDLKMPIIDGYSATQELRKDPKFKNIIVIGVTATMLTENQENFVKVCDGILYKPVHKEGLLNEINQHLAQIFDAQQPKMKSSISLDQNKQAQWTELLSILESLNDELLRVQKGNTFKQILAFGLKIQQLGLDYQCDHVTLWGTKLVKKSKLFDVKEIIELFNQYPHLIQEIREYT